MLRRNRQIASTYDAFGIRCIRAGVSPITPRWARPMPTPSKRLALWAHSSGNRQVGRERRDGAPQRRGKTQFPRAADYRACAPAALAPRLRIRRLRVTSHFPWCNITARECRARARNAVSATMDGALRPQRARTNACPERARGAAAGSRPFLIYDAKGENRGPAFLQTLGSKWRARQDSNPRPPGS